MQFDFDEVPVHWRHRLWGATEYDPTVNNGIFFFGDKGTVFATDRKWTFIPRGAKAEREEHEVNADMGKLHMADFLDAVRQRRQPGCPIIEGYQSTATVQLAMMSYESGTTVHWDDQKEEILNNPAASALLQRKYRQPWKHPFDA